MEQKPSDKVHADKNTVGRTRPISFLSAMLMLAVGVLITVAVLVAAKITTDDATGPLKDDIASLKTSVHELQLDNETLQARLAAAQPCKPDGGSVIPAVPPASQVSIDQLQRCDIICFFDTFGNKIYAEVRSVLDAAGNTVVHVITVDRGTELVIDATTLPRIFMQECPKGL